MVLYLQKFGSSLVRIIHLADKKLEDVSLESVPGADAAVITPGINENFQTDVFRFHLDTPFIYNRVYEYNVSRKALSLLEDFKMLGKSLYKLIKSTVTLSNYASVSIQDNILITKSSKFPS
jgi:hypothetical protein